MLANLLASSNHSTQPQYKMAHGTWTEENDLYITALRKRTGLSWALIAERFQGHFESQATAKDIESRWNTRLKNDDRVRTYGDCLLNGVWPIYRNNPIDAAILQIEDFVRELVNQGVQVSVCTTPIEINHFFLLFFLSASDFTKWRRYCFQDLCIIPYFPTTCRPDMA
jgi:Myb-like DNA-binding domain